MQRTIIFALLVCTASALSAQSINLVVNGWGNPSSRWNELSWQVDGGAAYITCSMGERNAAGINRAYKFDNVNGERFSATRNDGQWILHDSDDNVRMVWFRHQYVMENGNVLERRIRGWSQPRIEISNPETGEVLARAIVKKGAKLTDIYFGVKLEPAANSSSALQAMLMADLLQYYQINRELLF